MSWERKRVELKKAEARKPHGFSEGSENAYNNTCCLLHLAHALSCCWVPVLILLVVALTAMSRC